MVTKYIIMEVTPVLLRGMENTARGPLEKNNLQSGFFLADYVISHYDCQVSYAHGNDGSEAGQHIHDSAKARSLFMTLQPASCAGQQTSIRLFHNTAPLCIRIPFRFRAGFWEFCGEREPVRLPVCCSPCSKKNDPTACSTWYR